MYLVCEAFTIVELVKLVNECLETGYVCQGGICSTSENDEYAAKLYQAMVLK
jgi:hypothetical protein